MSPSPPASQRLLALDWLRGLVMVLMAVDHCDGATNPRHAAADSVWMWHGPLGTGDFLTRWCTHLCAPTFAFLCGAGMALSIARAQQRGERAWSIDRHWLLRGAVLLALEVTVLSFYWRFEQAADVVLQVLWAIGGGVVLLVPLRRLPRAVLLALALLLPVAVELLFQPLRWGPFGAHSAPAWNGLLLSGGAYAVAGVQVFVMYPLLAWLPPLLLGFLFGGRLARGDERAALRSLLWWGGGALLLFVAVRGGNGFGNAQLLRDDGSLVEWLHCSKYPPSAAFLLLELGLMALLLAALLVLARRRGDARPPADPLLLLGQVPLFFYLLHLPIIGALTYGGVFPRPGSWPRSWLMAFVVCALALPLCAWYRRRKQSGAAWTRYL